MNRKGIFGTLMLIFVLTVELAVPQAFARISNQPPQQSAPHTPLEAASNPSGSCDQLGLSGKVGYVVLTRTQQLRLFVDLQQPQAESDYSVWIGHKNSATSTCDGTWQQAGWINVEYYGSATFADAFSPSGGSQYIIELRNPTGAVLYATPFINA